jgi:hypothetical protein
MSKFRVSYWRNNQAVPMLLTFMYRWLASVWDGDLFVGARQHQ